MTHDTYSKDQFLMYFLDYSKYILNYGTNEIYKIKTVNSHILIEELIHYLEISKNKEIFNNNIIKILEELHFEISNDVISKSNNYMKDLISPFISQIGKIVGNGKQSFDEEIKKELLIRLNSINNLYKNEYINLLQKELNSLFLRINNESINGKTFTIFENLINSYFTEILYIGLSKRELLNIIFSIDNDNFFNDKYLDYLNINFFEKINICLNGDNNIISYLKITITKDIATSFKSFLKSKENFILLDSFEKINKKDSYRDTDTDKINSFFNIDDKNPKLSTIIFYCKGKGIDYISQGNNIKRLLDNMVDFLKWEFPKGNFIISPLYISYNELNNKYYTAYYYLDYEGHRQDGDMEYLDKRLNMFKKISNGNIDEEIEGKLFTMLKYYRLGLNSSTYEERFLNLWIGWEHIFSNNLNEKKGWNNIQKYVPYILTINHINQNLWLLIKGELNMEEKKLFFTFINKNRTYKEDLQPSCNLYIVLQDTELFNKLLEILGNNLIGKGKLLKLRNDLFIDDNKKIGEKTKAFLSDYNKKITLQLYRMNRIRNSIVHTGKNNFKLLEYITSDLEKYYLVILEDLLEHFTLRNGFSLDDYFLRTERSYENYINYICSEIFKSNDVKTRGERLTSPKIIL